MSKDGEEFERWYDEFSGHENETYGDFFNKPKYREAFQAGHAAARAEAQMLVDALEVACNCRRFTAKVETLCFACEALAAYRKEPRP